MKVLLPVTLIIMCSVMTACNKSSANILITGKWHIVTDVTTITGPDVTTTTYHGSITDYFNFSSDGKLHIKESSLDTVFNYNIESSGKIVLPGIGFSVNGVTEHSEYTLSGNKLVIDANPPGNIIPPGHQYYRTINLER